MTYQMVTHSTTSPRMMLQLQALGAMLLLACAACFGPDQVQGTPTYTDPGTLAVDPDAFTPADAATAAPQPLTLLYGINSEQCLTAVNGSQVQFTQCDGDSAQVWTFQHGQLQSSNGACLAAPSSAPKSGTPTTLAPCDSTYTVAAQQWVYQAGELVLNNSSLCILPAQGNPSVSVFTCGPQAQSNDDMWVLGHSTGTGVYGTAWTPAGGTSPCMTADANTGLITLQTCTNKSSQAWAPAGLNIVAMGAGLCVALDPTAGASGAAASLASCDGSAEQNWAWEGGQVRLQGTSTCLGVDSIAAGAQLHGVSCAAAGQTGQWALGLQ